MTDVGLVLQKWAQRTIINMKQVLTVNNKVNTRRLYDSITYVIDEVNKTFQITYISYGKFVDSGRRKGAKPPPRLPILQWLMTNHGRSFMTKLNADESGDGKKNKTKITNVTASYMVQKSISKNGIRPVRWLNQESKIKNVNNVFGSMKTDLQKALSKTKII